MKANGNVVSKYILLKQVIVLNFSRTVLHVVHHAIDTHANENQRIKIFMHKQFINDLQLSKEIIIVGDPLQAP